MHSNISGNLSIIWVSGAEGKNKVSSTIIMVSTVAKSPTYGKTHGFHLSTYSSTTYQLPEVPGNQPKQHVRREGFHVVISTNVHVNKMTRWLEWEGSKYSGEKRITAEARYGGESVTVRAMYRHGPFKGLLSVVYAQLNNVPKRGERARIQCAVKFSARVSQYNHANLMWANAICLAEELQST
jgi:hypothetical protein